MHAKKWLVGPTHFQTVYKNGKTKFLAAHFGDNFLVSSFFCVSFNGIGNSIKFSIYRYLLTTYKHILILWLRLLFSSYSFEPFDFLKKT